MSDPLRECLVHVAYGPKNAPKRMLKYNYTVSFDGSDRDVMLAADGYDVDPKAHIPKKVNICDLGVYYVTKVNFALHPLPPSTH